jgi:hypothetical protein
MKILSIILLAILTVCLAACWWDTPTAPDPTPEVTQYAYEGTFISDSGRDLQGYRWEFEFRDVSCTQFKKGKLGSDYIMKENMDCLPTNAHEVRLYTLIYDPAHPGPDYSVQNVSWVASADGTHFTFTFHVK